MLKHFVATIFACYLVACGQRESSDNPPATQTEEAHVVAVQIDPRLQPIVDEFLEDCARFNKYDFCMERIQSMTSIIAVPVSELKASMGLTLGVCQYDNSVQPVKPVKIMINESIMEKPEMLKNTVYHELGHCVLSKGHAGRKDPIMRSYVWKNEISEQNVEKLFTVPAQPMDNR